VDDDGDVIGIVKAAALVSNVASSNRHRGEASPQGKYLADGSLKTDPYLRHIAAEAVDWATTPDMPCAYVMYDENEVIYVGCHQALPLQVYLDSPPRLAHAARNGVRNFSRPATENTAVLLDDPAPSAYSIVARW
jgi:hypothetical protein